MNNSIKSRSDAVASEVQKLTVAAQHLDFVMSINLEEKILLCEFYFFRWYS